MSASATALLIVDMISDWQFEDAEHLSGPAAGAALVIDRLRQRCAAVGAPVIYANDNRGHWRTDFAGLVQQSLDSGGIAARITGLLRPTDHDYFVLKPRHSAFFATPLEILLRQLDVGRLIVTGVSTEQCVYMTVAEARLRELEVWVPSDAVASQTERRRQVALEQIDQALLYPTAESEDPRMLADFLGEC